MSPSILQDLRASGAFVFTLDPLACRILLQPIAYSLASQAFFCKNHPKSALPQHMPDAGVGIDARGLVSPYVTL
jgi:hypothetical protein